MGSVSASASEEDSAEKSGVRMRWRDIGSGALIPRKKEKRKGQNTVSFSVKRLERHRLTDKELSMVLYPRY